MLLHGLYQLSKRNPMIGSVGKKFEYSSSHHKILRIMS